MHKILDFFIRDLSSSIILSSYQKSPRQDKKTSLAEETEEDLATCYNRLQDLHPYTEPLSRPLVAYHHYYWQLRTSYHYQPGKVILLYFFWYLQSSSSQRPIIIYMYCLAKVLTPGFDVSLESKTLWRLKFSKMGSLSR